MYEGYIKYACQFPRISKDARSAGNQPVCLLLSVFHRERMKQEQQGSGPVGGWRQQLQQFLLQIWPLFYALTYVCLAGEWSVIVSRVVARLEILARHSKCRQHREQLLCIFSSVFCIKFLVIFAGKFK